MQPTCQRAQPSKIGGGANRSVAGIFTLSSGCWSLWSENSLVKILAPYLSPLPSDVGRNVFKIRIRLINFYILKFSTQLFQTCRDDGPYQGPILEFFSKFFKYTYIHSEIPVLKFKSSNIYTLLQTQNNEKNILCYVKYVYLCALYNICGFFFFFFFFGKRL